MIKSVHLTTVVHDAGDFDLLVKLVEALGFRKAHEPGEATTRWQEFLPSALTLQVVRPGANRPADLDLMISDPDSAADILVKMGYKIVRDQSGPGQRHIVRDFLVELPGGTSISVMGIKAEETGEAEQDGLVGDLRATDKHFALVVSRFNSFISERLLAGAIDGLVRCGAKRHGSIEIVRVPGAFEIPLAARTLAKTRKYDAIICLGCLLRGDTAHYDVIVNEVTRGIGQSAQETGVHHAFGVLTCDTLEQAIDRAGLKMGNKGFEAALAAVEMANLQKAVVGRSSTVVGGKKPVSSQPSALSKKKPKPRTRPKKRTR